MKRWIAVLAVGVLSLTVAQTALAKQSSVVIQGYELGFFNGSVKGFAGCKQNRRVELWEDKDLAGGHKDSMLGFAKTDNVGRWSINDSDGTGGTYYAYAKRKTGKTKKGKKYTCPEVESLPFTR